MGKQIPWLIPRRTWLHVLPSAITGVMSAFLADSKEELLNACCGAELDKVRQRGRYVVPEFGFVSESGTAMPSSHREISFPGTFFGSSLELDETVRPVGEFEVSNLRSPGQLQH